MSGFHTILTRASSSYVHASAMASWAPDTITRDAPEGDAFRDMGSLAFALGVALVAAAVLTLLVWPTF